MSSAVSILISLLILSVLIAVHELGHLLVGKLFKFGIVEYAIGMGPKLSSVQIGKTEFAFRTFPIGGMCIFYDDSEDAKEVFKEYDTEGMTSFDKHPVWQRILVLFSGPFMNILLAFLLGAVSLGVYGNYMPKITEIPSVTSPAGQSDLQVNDIIVGVNGKSAEFYNDALQMIQDSDSDKMELTVLRDGEKKKIVLNDVYNEEQGGNYLGVMITPEKLSYNVLECIGHSFGYSWMIIKETVSGFLGLFNGSVSASDFSGPVGTVAYMSEAVKYGLETILNLAILLSLSLAVLNLFPFPALDGGRILFCLIELITRKKISKQTESKIHFIGMMILLAFIIFLTFKDVNTLWRG